MAVKELIFNNSKWFSINPDSQNITIKGKQFLACPKYISVKKWNSDDDQWEYAKCACQGVGYDPLSHRLNYIISAQGAGLEAISSTDVKNIIWGGKLALLSHLYHWLSHAFTVRKAVIE